MIVKQIWVWIQTQTAFKGKDFNELFKSDQKKYIFKA